MNCFEPHLPKITLKQALVRCQLCRHTEGIICHAAKECFIGQVRLTRTNVVLLQFVSYK